jgi:catalase
LPLANLPFLFRSHKFVKADGSFVYFQWHYIAKGGFKTLPAEKAGHLAGANPDYSNEDLFRAIEAGDYPEWEASVQIMTPQEAEAADINILDLTKVWPHDKFPLRPVGKLVLNENPQKYVLHLSASSCASLLTLFRSSQLLRRD